mgnify:FL=1
MCLILFAYQSHPDYRLVLAANRDEFYDRPTRHLAYWDDAPEILAGRDLKAGGTWMGVTRTGRIAAITNYREAGSIRENAPSRGDLVKGFLMSGSKPCDYLKAVRGKGQAYNGFNLIIGDAKGLYYYSNHGESIQTIEPGIHGLSNHLLDTPWPKVIQGKSRLLSLIDRKEAFSHENIFQILSDRSIPSDDDLPDTGVGLEWERVLSPLFITSDIYGTRCASILLWKHTGEVTFLERTFGRQGGVKQGMTTQSYTFIASE